MRAINTLLVCQWFPPEPIVVPLSIATELHDRGHTVEVLTGIPNYPTGQVAAGYRPWRRSREIRDGLPVHRTPLYPSHDSSALKRMANYLSWALSSTLGGFRTIRRADVALVYSSPATAALAPAVWRAIARTPFVLLIQDLWPDSVAASGMARRGIVTTAAEWALHRFVAWTYRRAAHVVVISPSMIDVLASRGVPRDKITLVYNWASDEGAAASSATRSTARSELGIDEDAFVLAYAGNHGVAQGLRNVIEAAALIGEDHLDVVFVLAGDGVETPELVDLARSTARANVIFPGRLDATQMASLRLAADVQLVSLIDDELFAVTMPSKVQSILASAQPLIVVAPGDAAAVAHESGAGWAVPPGDPAALAAAALTARATSPTDLSEMAQAGRTYYEAAMGRDIGGHRLDVVLRNAADSTTSTLTNGEPR